MAGFSVTITAVDGATKAIDAINKRLTALMAPVTRLQKSLSKFGDLTGLNAVGRALGTVASMAGRAARNIALIVTPLTAITSAISVASLVRMVDAWGKFAQRLGFDAIRIGIAADRLHALQGAARLAGSSSEALTEGMRSLNDTLTEAAGGRNGEAVVLLRTLGIEFLNLDGSVRKAVDVLPEAADAIAKIRNPALQARAAAMLFGSSAEDLLPFLRRGSAGMREYAAAAARYGVVSAEGTRVAGVMREAQTKLGLAFEGLGNKVSEKVAPVLTRLFDFMAEWTLKNSAKLVTFVENIAKAFENWAKNGGLDRLVDALEKIAHTIASMSMPKWMQRFLGIADPDEKAEEGLGAGLPTDTWPPAMRRAAGLPSYPGGIFAMTDGNVGTGWGHITNPVTGFTGVPDMMGINSGVARGLRNNNPLNLSFLPGQGAQGSDGRFGRYATMEAGVAAAHRQLMLYQNRGTNTLEKIISRWAPPSENDTETYVRNVSAWTGFKRDEVLDMKDPTTAEKVIGAMARMESGNVAPDIIARGVAMGIANAPEARGAPVASLYGAPGAGGAAAVNGTIKADITIRGAPPGTTASVTATGPVRATARVETAMAGGGGAP